MLSDNMTQFSSKVFLSLCTFLGMKKLTTSVYYMQSNGHLERFNSTLITHPPLYVAEHEKIGTTLSFRLRTHLIPRHIGWRGLHHALGGMKTSTKHSDRWSLNRVCGYCIKSVCQDATTVPPRESSRNEILYRRQYQTDNPARTMSLPIPGKNFVDVDKPSVTWPPLTGSRMKRISNCGLGQLNRSDICSTTAQVDQRQAWNPEHDVFPSRTVCDKSCQPTALAGRKLATQEQYHNGNE